MRRTAAWLTGLVVLAGLLPAMASTTTAEVAAVETAVELAGLLARADGPGVDATARASAFGDGRALPPLRSAHPAELLRVARFGAPHGRVGLRYLALAAEQAGESGLMVQLQDQREAPQASTRQAGVSLIGPILYGVGPQPVLAIGDLDGDGTDDVITVEHRGTGLTLKALRGIDGRPLWVAPQDDDISGALLQTVPDVDGDGHRDVTATAIEYGTSAWSGECSENGCSDSYEETIVSRFSVLSGATGTPLWHDEVDGFVRQAYTYDFESGAESSTFESSNFGVRFIQASDLDGDGAEDLVSVRQTITESHAQQSDQTIPGVSSSEESASFEADSTVLLIDGADGSTIGSYEELDRSSALTAQPIPDVNGDGVTDLLGQRFHGADGMRTCSTLLIQQDCEGSLTRPGVDVLYLDGATREPLWTVALDSAHAFAQAPGELTSDDAVDVIVTGYDVPEPGDGPVMPSLTALDGRDGAQLWTDDGPSHQADEDADTEEETEFAYVTAHVVAATDLDDEPGRDLIADFTRYSYDYETGVEDLTTTLSRLNGRTGESLLETEHSSTDQGVYFGSFARGVQADGDGSTDILLQRFDFDPETGSASVVFLVESGRTGTPLMERAEEGLTDLQVLGDVDADGGDEAAVTDFGFGVISGGVGTTQPVQGSATEQATATAEPAPTASATPASSTRAATRQSGPPAGGAIEVIDLDGGATLWSRPALPSGLLTLRGVGDLDGAGGGDVLAEGVSFAGDQVRSLTAARVGSDGTLLWSDPPPIPLQRVAGDTRITTAAALSVHTREQADTVLVARADSWPDAIAGGPLAAALDASLLLSDGSALSPETAAEIARLGASRAVLLGGPAALAQQVAQDLRADGLAVQRLAGADRFETAALIAAEVARAGGDTSEVSVVRGSHDDPTQGWSDAVVAAARGAAQGHPILLTEPDEIPAVTRQALSDLGASSALVLGGPGAVSADVERQLRDAGVSSLRIAGFDRYSTAHAVAELAVDDGVDLSTVWVATGLRFPDALAASAAAGSGGVLLLTTGIDTDPARQLFSFLGTHRDDIDQIVLIGGPAALSSSLEARLRAQFSD